MADSRIDGKVIGMVEVDMTELADKAKLEGYVVVIGCKRCGKCDSVCPTGALKKRDGYVYIDYELCDVCLKCIEVCPNKALSYLE